MKNLTAKRRIFLQGLAATTCLTAFGWPAIGRAQNTETLGVQPLADRISLITGAGGNVVVFKGERGLTLIDSGETSRVTDLLARVDELSGASPITTLFNTHWHADHTGGNEAIRARGASIIAHENTKLWLGAEFAVEWRQQAFKPRPEAAWPDTTFYTSGQLDLGGETVDYSHPGQAHTDGDSYLYFPTSNVLVAGGLLSHKKYPITDIATGGWIGGLLNANQILLEKADANTIIVPDRGPALTKADLQAQHDMLADLYEKMKVLTRQGLNAQQLLQAGVTADYDAAWGDPTEFVLETYRGMWAHTYDMGGYI